jgi:hypothetical protein
MIHADLVQPRKFLIGKAYWKRVFINVLRSLGNAAGQKQ